MSSAPQAHRADLTPAEALRIARDPSHHHLRPTYALIQCAAYFNALAGELLAVVKERHEKGNGI